MRVQLAVMTMSVLPLQAAASPATAQHRRAKIAFGYAYSHYLEEGGGSAPLGAFVSVASRSAGTASKWMWPITATRRTGSCSTPSSPGSGRVTNSVLQARIRFFTRLPAGATIASREIRTPPLAGRRFRCRHPGRRHPGAQVGRRLSDLLRRGGEPENSATHLRNRF